MQVNLSLLVSISQVFMHTLCGPIMCRLEPRLIHERTCVPYFILHHERMYNWPLFMWKQWLISGLFRFRPLSEVTSFFLSCQLGVMIFQWHPVANTSTFNKGFLQPGAELVRDHESCPDYFTTHNETNSSAEKYSGQIFNDGACTC